MERIVIIDHDSHQAFIEDIDEDVLNAEYDGEEEKFIKENYGLENFSWDYVVTIVYYTADGDAIDVEPSDWV